GVAQALALDAQGHHRGLAAGDDERIQPVKVGGNPHLARDGAEALQDLGVGLEVALESQDADQRRGVRRGVGRGLRRGVGHGYQPRPARSCSDSSLEVSRLTMGWPRPVEAAATRAGSRKWVVASTIARARRSGSSDLKMPEPTNTPSAPSCI